MKIRNQIGKNILKEQKKHIVFDLNGRLKTASDETPYSEPLDFKWSFSVFDNYDRIIFRRIICWAFLFGLTGYIVVSNLSMELLIPVITFYVRIYTLYCRINNLYIYGFERIDDESDMSFGASKLIYKGQKLKYSAIKKFRVLLRACRKRRGSK